MTKTVVEAKVHKQAVGTGFELKIEPITAHKGDTIKWFWGEYGKPAHTFSIWFPQPGVFVTPLIAVMHNGTVEATIREDIRDGVPPDEVLKFDYCIYDHTEQEFVTCQSHPKLEIPGP